ncbi:unnamed protein product [Lactuca virosa]|uniref:Glabrous enhancer-binding protein-like DBD domain-containing protein n=1 Tax=Lactuca virosa TaxID=75947 RepID=A0AAU9NGL1_9ASTR|nr:unnamed protein product [Lactuca virosa]
MDFTPPSNPPMVIQQPNPISSIPSSGSKLPIKRKTPTSTLILSTPKLESDDDDADPDPDPDHDAIARQPPFKFHRIWTEPDEIRFLQGLLDCSSQGLSFPRDLGIFYSRFSHGMSQPYTKSQLSEKLRRLRKKFRVISSRLSKGLDKALLSPQDRALYDLSKQLWEPDHPFLPSGVSNSDSNPVNNHNCKPNLVGVKVSFSPTLPSSSMAVLALPSVIKETNNRSNRNKFNNLAAGAATAGGFNGDVKLNDVNVELERNAEMARKEVRVKSGGDDVMHFANKTLADVLDQSLKEIKTMIDLQRDSNLEKEISFEKRWRDQHIAEFDVLAKRLKLIVEHSSLGTKL